MLNQFFDRVDDALSELADRAGTDQEQTRYFDAMRELRLRRKSNSEALRHLSLRVRHLIPGVTLEDDQMPLCPEVLCGGLAAASKDLDVDIRARLIVLKLFDQLLVTSLGEVYYGANQTLIKEGVLPDSKAVRPAHMSCYNKPYRTLLSSCVWLWKAWPGIVCR